MLTRDELAELSDGLSEQKVLSIYLDGRVTDPAARLAWRSILADNLAVLRHKTSERPARDRRDFERSLSLLEERLATVNGALKSPGFVAFVTAERVALADSLPVAMPNVARWESGPWISPYMRAQKELRPVILAVVDARSARSFRYALGSLSSLAAFHAHVQVGQPIHMGAAPAPSFHTGTRGATATDAIDRAHEHGTHRMLRELVAHVMKVAPADEWIVIGGMPMRAGLLLTMLPPAARRRAVVAAGLSKATPTSTLRHAAHDQARRLGQQFDKDIVDTAVARAAEQGRGSVGEEATRAALGIRDVHMLLLSNRFMTDRPEVAEEMSRLALASGATIDVVSPPAADRLDRAGGVAGLLRYVAPVTA